jgi:hypothetical protein
VARDAHAAVPGPCLHALDDPGSIHGRVVDATGQPVKDAAIFLRDESAHLLDRLSMIQSAADGSFEYKGVSAGEYVVSARGKSLASVESAAVPRCQRPPQKIVSFVHLVRGDEVLVAVALEIRRGDGSRNERDSPQREGPDVEFRRRAE